MAPSRSLLPVSESEDKSEICFDVVPLGRGILQQMLRTKLQVNSIYLIDVTIGFHRTFRWLASLSPREIIISSIIDNEEFFPEIFAKSFFLLMSTLQSISIHGHYERCRPILVPDDAKIPYQCGTYEFMVFPLQKVVETIRACYEGEEILTQWNICTRDDVCSDIEQLAEAIAVPYTLDEDNAYKIVIISQRGKRINVYEKLTRSNRRRGSTIGWDIEIEGSENNSEATDE